MNKSENKKLNLFLGDIIKIIAPDNSKFHDKIYYIDYIDDKMIKIINKTSEDFLYLGETGQLTELSIKEIHIVKRNKVNSYALLNNLNLDTWIDIKFGGELPFILTGIITNLIEDMIEIETFPNKDIIFIDFAYKGIPIDLNIEYIQIREEPISYREETRIQEDELPDINNKKLTPITENDEQTDERTEKTIEELIKEDESIEKNKETDEIEEVIPEAVSDELEIEYDDILEPVIQYVNVSKERQRYVLEEQKDDMINKYLDQIPEHKKLSKDVKNYINKLINRFEDLRNSYTIFDENDNPSKIKTHGKNFNTLKDVICNSDNRFKHIIPVSSIKKNIYDESFTGSDSIYLTFNEELQTDFTNYKSYENKVINYDDYNNVINDSFTPYSRPTNKSYYLPINVNNNITSIIDNDDLYEINTVGTNYKTNNTSINTYKYFQQVYVSEIKFNDKIIMLNETMDLKSIITLPFNYALLNNINLLHSNMLDKLSISNNYIGYNEILNNKLNLNTNLITQHDKLFENNNNYSKVFTHVTEHILDDDIETNNNNYKKFISTALPNTSDVINHVINKHKQLSMFEYIKLLESYNIYTHDLHFNEYKIILDALYSNINLFWEYYKAERKLFNFDISRLSKHSKRVYPINFLEILDNFDKEIINENLLYKNYKKTIEFKSNSEYLSYINNYDTGNLLFEIIKLGANKLINNVDLNYNKLEEQPEQDKELFPEQINNCNVYNISKKYDSLDKLNYDNDKVIYYDKAYDDIVYDILNVYNDDKENMSEDDFKKFLIGKLIEVNGIDQNKATNLAEDMLVGRKKVREGDYCILQNVSDDYEISDIEYYKRTNDKWIYDESASKNSIKNSLEINDNICDDVKCFENTINSKELKFNFKDKNISPSNEMYEKTLTDLPINKSFNCVTQNDKKQEIKKKLLDKMMEEFKHQILKNKENIESNIVNIIKNNNKLQEINNIIRNQYQNFALQLSSKTIVLDTIKSPYSNKLDEIMEDDDMFERNLNILNFIHKYTRPSIYPENKYYYYCKATNTKLIPTFYFKIALVIVQNKHSFDNSKYIETIDLIYKEQGREEDGFIIDNYSNEVIAPINYNIDEGYDEKGHKNVSRSVVETVDVEIKDDQEIIIDDIENKFLSLNEMIDDDDIGLIQEDLYKTNIKEFITGIVNYITQEINMDLGNHKEFIIYKTITIFEKYKTKKNEEYTLVLLTIAMVFIGIQMFFPRVTGKYVRVNDCKASFKGFPLENDSTYDGISFFSCLIAKRRKKINKKLKQSDETKIKEQLITIIKSFILDNIQDELVDIKQKEIEKMKLLDVFIKKTLTFLPPLNKFNISKSLLQNHLSSIKSSIKQKTDVLNVFNSLKSKNILYSYGLIELINDNIEGVDLNLQNYSTNEYFMENSCCTTNSVSNIIDYLSEKETDILRYINIIKENEKFISEYNTLPQTIRSIENFKKNTTTNIEKYTNKTVETFFNNYINDEYQEKTYSSMIQKMNEIYSIQNKKQIVKNIDISIDKYFISLFTKNESIETDTLNTSIIDYIEMGNSASEIKDIIIQKIELNNLLNNKILNLKKSYKEFTNNKFTYLVDDFISLKSNNSIQVIKNNIINYCHNLPLILINNVSHSITLPKHWNLSSNHYKLINSLINDNYTLIEQFKNNSDVKDILIHSVDKYKLYEKIIININTLLLNNNEYYLDKEIVHKILQYYFLKIITHTIENIKSIQLNKLYKDILNKYSSHFKLNNKIYDFDISLLKKRVLKAKEAEKDRITKKLKKKNDAERQASNALKKNKLGDWSIGEQKGLTVYDKNFRDIHRPEGEEAYYQLDIENELQDHTNEDN